VYWKPVWHVLEDDFELVSVSAHHVKQLALVIKPTRDGSCRHLGLHDVRALVICPVDQTCILMTPSATPRSRSSGERAPGLLGSEETAGRRSFGEDGRVSIEVLR